jgi:hypothetical protein
MSAATAVLVVLLAVVFLALGTAKTLALGPMRALAAEVGFSTAAYRRIGALEVLGAMGLLTGLAEPLIGGLAGTGLFLLVARAVVVHLRNGHGPRKHAPAAVAGLLAAAYLIAAIGGRT